MFIQSDLDWCRWDGTKRFLPFCLF